MEFARIIAMAMILIGHFVFHGIQKGMPSPGELPRMGSAEITLMSLWIFCTPGVDLFMLISGYYGIRLSWRKILSFWMLCIFYNAVNLFVNTPNVNFIQIIDIFFISKTGNWFFRAYLWVLLASPLINNALAAFDIKRLRILCVIGIALLCISSWKFANPNGNSALMLMVLYFLGGYLRREPVVQRISAKQAGLCYLILAGATIGSCFIAYNVLHKQYGIFLQHNCLFVVMMSVSLLLLFKSLNLKSKIINVWASTVVAALFIQDVILYVPLYDYFHTLYLAEGLTVHLWMALLISTAAIFAAAFIIEWPRQKVANLLLEPLVCRLDKKLNIAKIFNS